MDNFQILRACDARKGRAARDPVCLAEKVKSGAEISSGLRLKPNQKEEL
jgi:hypothetical protein